MSEPQNKLILSSELTKTHGLESLPSFRADTDHLVRVMTDETSSSRYYVAETSDVQAKISEWLSFVYQDLQQLKDVAQWQHKVIDYNSVYQAFLMDQLTDEEFESEAEKFVYEPVKMFPDELAAKVDRVYRLTGIHYTPSEISDLFKCDHDDAIQAISIVQASNPELSYMLPEGAR